ncbi:MAG: archaemetzincin family Zn-dependent metalloprotease [Thermoprotei archaeon]
MSSYVAEVLLVKLTPVDDNLINAVVSHLARLGFRTSVLIWPLHVPLTLFDWSRRQFKAEYILDQIVREFRQFPFDAIIAIGYIDAYADGYNFVFGYSTKKFGTVYTKRLKSEDMSLYAIRVVKEVTHELGHALGLEHCDNPHCVMSLSNSIEEVDRKSPFFCDKCKAKLLGLLKFQERV